MKGKIVILPGTPNDENRDYLPEAIKGSDMVVNENGNNSQVYPPRLQEFKDVLLDGIQDTWYEYVPAVYDGSVPVPLVISMHGGMMTGWGQAIYTSWTMVADREGFICLFPNASKRRFWLVEYEKEKVAEATAVQDNGVYLNAPPDNPDDNHDMNMVLKLIERLKAKYHIDAGRIFMQGMSMGNLMTSQFARYHGDVLAGKAGSAGPSSPGLLYDEQGRIINRAGPLAVWQTRMERDAVPPSFTGDTDTVVKKNRNYWRIINQCDTLPEIKIVGEDNLAFFRGAKADIVFRDVKNRDHGQTLDDAELVWDYLFSGVRRNADGKIVNSPPNLPRRGDAFAIALTLGSSKAYVHNRLVALAGPVFKHQKLKYHGQNGGALVRGEYFMVPVSSVAAILGAQVTMTPDGCSATLVLPGGMTLQFARGSIGCVVDNAILSMYCEAVLRNGELCVPIEWICRRLLNHHASICDDVLYITDHDAELSVNMAHLIRDEILNERVGGAPAGR
jgi:poly(3-hydroxybutyrate) depolymerase